MTGDSVSPRNEKVSVKRKSSPFQGASFKVVDLNYTDITHSGNDKCTLSKSDPQSSELFSTTDLISAVGYAWGSVRKPLSILLSKTNSTCKPKVNYEAGILHYSIYEGTIRASTSAGDPLFSHNYSNNKENSAKLVEEYREHSRLNYELFWSSVIARSTVIEGTTIENCLSSTVIPSNLGSTYEWMNEKAIDKSNNQVNSIEIESKRTTNHYTGDCLTISGSGCVPSDKTSTSNSLTTGFSASKPEAEELLDLSVGKGKAGNFELKPSTTTCSEDELASCSYVDEDCIKESSNGVYEDQEDKGTTFVNADSSEIEISLSEKRKPLYTVAKQEHAFAGAMAGIFVSLSLHPVDTIKTVIQSCRYDQKPLHSIGRSIIAERGRSLKLEYIKIRDSRVIILTWQVICKVS